MAYTKRPAGGIQFQRATTTTVGASTFETIPGFTATITLPGGQPTKVDITTHDDVLTFGRFKQNGAGLADVTDPGGTVLFDPDDTVHQAMLADFAAGTARDYRFIFPGGIVKRWGCRGQLGISPNGDINGYLQAQVTVLANTVDFDVP